MSIKLLNHTEFFSSVPQSPGKDDYEHRLFLTTNEHNQQKTLNILAKNPLSGNTLMGVSGFFILNAAAIMV